MTCRIKISKRYSCDSLFSLPYGSWENGWRSFGATRGLAEARSGGRRWGPGSGCGGGDIRGIGLYPLSGFSLCRGAGAGAVPAPPAHRAAGEALPPPQSSHGFLGLAAFRPGEEIRDPALPVHAGAGGTGHGPQPVGDAGGPEGGSS